MIKIFYNLLVLIALMSIFNSCVNDKDYDTPQIICEDFQVSETQIVPIQNILNLYKNTMVEIASEKDIPVYMSGYVVSSDAMGNFYQELFIQDNVENPRSGIKILVAMSSLYSKFNVGSKIYLQLNGLSIDKIYGELVVGLAKGGVIGRIPEYIAKSILGRDCKVYNITPKNITLDELDKSLGLYVQLNNMQFDFSVLGNSFVDQNDDFDTHLPLVSCSLNREIYLETSTFVKFKAQIIPSNQGSVKGVITRDYQDKFYVIKINELDDINFSASRCKAIFKENFSDGFTDWTVYNMLGNQTWVIDSQYGNPSSCAKILGHFEQETVNEDWLISPPIDLSEAITPYLTFQTSRAYKGPSLKVKYTTEYKPNDNPHNFKWIDL